MSEHTARVIEVGTIETHPNADALDLVRVEGWTVAVRRGEWKAGDLAVFVEPDTVVPLDRPEFAFLKRARITAMRLRGVWSEGLLVKAPLGLGPGADAWDALGLARYEPQIHGASTAADTEADVPALLRGAPVYDLENWRRYGAATFREGEPVIAHEKLHGANGRFAFVDGRAWVGSRTRWVRFDADAPSIWWRTFDDDLERLLRASPEVVFYGEVFGQVQDLRYGAAREQVWLRAFDAYDLAARVWWSPSQLAAAVPEARRVPEVYRGPHDAAALVDLSMRDSVLAPHMAEGIVIRGEVPRDLHHGRNVLKLVSARYLEKQR